MAALHSAMKQRFSAEVLAFDARAAVEQISDRIRYQVQHELRRRGVVIGLSGGVDSSVTLFLCVHALGPGHVFGVLTPERVVVDDSLILGSEVAAAAHVRHEVWPIGETLAAAGCYRLQAEAIRRVMPDYEEGWPMKIVLPHEEAGVLNVFSLVVEPPGEPQRRVRLTADAYLQLVAATNMKQRLRKQVEYYHADRLRYAVAGTPNRLEYDQGFFVKNGDGAADLKPIAHLYKTQVYALARTLGVPETIIGRTPTTDTYSLPQTQEEFFFSLPYDKLDLCLWGLNHAIPAAEVADAAGLTAEHVEWVYRDIQAKRRTTAYNHRSPLLVEPVLEVSH